MMNKLVFFLGPAGAGKTTLAKAIASRRKVPFFDMDILLRPAADAIMTFTDWTRQTETLPITKDYAVIWATGLRWMQR